MLGFIAERMCSCYHAVTCNQQQQQQQQLAACVWWRWGALGCVLSMQCVITCPAASAACVCVVLRLMAIRARRRVLLDSDGLWMQGMRLGVARCVPQSAEGHPVGCAACMCAVPCCGGHVLRLLCLGTAPCADLLGGSMRLGPTRSIMTCTTACMLVSPAVDSCRCAACVPCVCITCAAFINHACSAWFIARAIGLVSVQQCVAAAMVACGLHRWRGVDCAACIARSACTHPFDKIVIYHQGSGYLDLVISITKAYQHHKGVLAVQDDNRCTHVYTCVAQQRRQGPNASVWQCGACSTVLLLCNLWFALLVFDCYIPEVTRAHVRMHHLPVG
ncbi:hypothetical protein COO60DRAFT_44946 [Scenedesmus sp. NREL 46B-D3]|nr:hypothetical protein COO60DRAFT_44946 [Scenedesmus sp. NREL 46B-D3]